VGEGVGEVGERAGRAGCGDAPVVSDLGVREFGLVHDHARPAASRPRRDLDRAAVADQAVHVRRRAMAQDGAAPAREDRGHGFGVWRGWEVAEGVDTLVDANEPPGLQPAVDVLRANPGIEELGTGDDAVLLCRETLKSKIRHFSPYRGEKRRKLAPQRPRQTGQAGISASLPSRRSPAP
jgi:hypothetical protein